MSWFLLVAIIVQFFLLLSADRFVALCFGPRGQMSSIWIVCGRTLSSPTTWRKLPIVSLAMYLHAATNDKVGFGFKVKC